MIQKNMKYLLCFLGGIFFALGFPSALAESLFITPLIGVLLLFYFLEQSPLKTRLMLVLLFCLGLNLCGYYWLPKTLQIFGELPFLISHIISLLFALIILPQYIAYALLIPYAKKFTLFLQEKVKINSPSFPIFVQAFILILLENFIPQQFPSHLGHPWIGLGEHLGLAPFLGIPVFSFVSYIFIFALIHYLRRKKHSLLSYAVIFIFIVLNPLLVKSPSQETKNFHVRISQANVGNYLKLESEKGDLDSVEKVMTLFKNLAAEPYLLGKQKADIVIWSETSFPYSLNSNNLKSNIMTTPNIFKEIMNTSGAEFLTGGYDQKSNQKDWFEREYNAVFFFNRSLGLSDVYHKHILIPFGETLPFGPLNSYLSRFLQNIAFFSKGEKFPLFQTQDNFTFITPVCYELLYADFIRNYLMANDRPADIIINLTNDSWYEEPEPQQHLFLTRWRALEYSIPVIRSTNTGITTLIMPNVKL